LTTSFGRDERVFNKKPRGGWRSQEPGPGDYAVRTKVGQGNSLQYRPDTIFRKYAQPKPGPAEYTLPSFMQTNTGFSVGLGDRPDITEGLVDQTNPAPNTYMVQKGLLNHRKGSKIGTSLRTRPSTMDTEAPFGYDVSTSLSKKRSDLCMVKVMRKTGGLAQKWNKRQSPAPNAYKV